MAYLIDTSVLCRLTNTIDPQYPYAIHAVAELHRRHEALHLTSQNFIEFRNVATRPKGVNGLGLSIKVAEFKVQIYASTFSLLEETPAIYPAWKNIVESLGIIGKQVHDARLVAICHVHQVSHLLTFNVGHFTRMASFGRGLQIVDPASI